MYDLSYKTVFLCVGVKHTGEFVVVLLEAAERVVAKQMHMFL